jgi:hypothetical protein
VTATARKQNPTYPANVREYARRLYCDFELSPYEIHNRMLRLSIDPCPVPSTIRRWADPDYCEAERQGRRRGGRPGPDRKVKTWRLRLERIKELRAVGLSWEDVSRVMNLDFDLSLSRTQVRMYAEGRVGDRILRHRLYPEGAK